MKKSLNKLVFIVGIFLINSLTIAAQIPGDENDTGNLEGPEPAAAPINNFLFKLTIAAIIYAFYYLKNKKTNNALD